MSSVDFPKNLQQNQSLDLKKQTKNKNKKTTTNGKTSINLDFSKTTPVKKYMSLIKSKTL